MAKAKDYRDAITGHYMKKEEALAHPENSVAETRVKKERKPRKPRPVKPVVPADDSIIPDSGIPENETPEQKAFRLKMAVVYKGDIYLNKKELPVESQEYLMNKDSEWSE